jgi:hypothetical protein
MRTIRAYAAVLAMTALAISAAPQSTTTTRRPAAAPATRTAAAPKLTDAQLEAAIKAKFAKSKIHEDKFTVRVQGGVAHIDGKTGVLQHKGVATRMAKTAGAAMVDNRVEVSQEAKDKAAGNLETGRRRVQVKRSDARSDQKAPK